MLYIQDLLNESTTATLFEEYEETKHCDGPKNLLEPQSLKGTDLDGLIKLVG